MKAPRIAAPAAYAKVPHGLNGAKKAILAVAASMLTAAYHMLKNGVPYHDLGAQHFSSRGRSKAILRLVRRLNDLGCQVHITPQAA